MKGWIVTKDYTDLCNNKDFKEVEIVGPRNCSIEKEELLKGHPFKMFDDDDNIYFEGFLIGDNTGHDGFMPLDNYGTPAAGCSYIKYKVEGTWEVL